MQGKTAGNCLSSPAASLRFLPIVVHISISTKLLLVVDPAGRKLIRDPSPHSPYPRHLLPSRKMSSSSTEDNPAEEGGGHQRRNNEVTYEERHGETEEGNEQEEDEEAKETVSVLVVEPEKEEGERASRCFIYLLLYCRYYIILLFRNLFACS